MNYFRYLIDPKFKYFFCALIIITIVSKVSYCSYIEECQIVPQNPSNTDTIKIVTTLFFNTNFTSSESEVRVDDNEVMIHINAYQGNFDIVESIDIIDLIGRLDAGYYSYLIDVNFYSWDWNDEEYVQTDADFTRGYFAVGEVEVNESLGTTFPYQFSIHAAYPNPFNSDATIHFTLDKTSSVQLMLYDLIGREIDLLYSGQLSAGDHQANINGQGLKSGMYIVRMRVGERVVNKKLTFIK